MNGTVKYMTMKECRLYKEIASQQGVQLAGMPMTFPCDPLTKDDFRQTALKTTRKNNKTKK